MNNDQALLTVAVSSRALFEMSEAHAVYASQGRRAFRDYMLARENEPLQPGVAFGLVSKLLGLNDDGHRRVEVVLLSRNSPQAGIRVMRSVMAHGLAIRRAVFVQGSERFRFAKALGANLFLSANEEDVGAAIRNGVAAARMIPSQASKSPDRQVRIAFDGDSVLFSDEADRMFERLGLERWRDFEHQNAGVPLADGPFRQVIECLHRVRVSLGEAAEERLRIALVTARGAPAHERALMTLRHWQVEVDEAVFADGLAKGPLVQALSADVLFDNCAKQIASAERCDVPGGHVDAGEQQANHRP